MTARHIFLAISCAVLVHSISYATPSGAAPQAATVASSVTDHPWEAAHTASANEQSHHKNIPAGKRDQRRGPATNQAPGRCSLTNRLRQLPNDRERPTSGNPMNIRQPASNRSDAASKEGLLQNDTTNRVLTVRAPTVSWPGGPPRDNTRHRGPNPAVVDGTMNSKTGNTGAINATRMNPRP
jgi:hypothetical protein